MPTTLLAAAEALATTDPGASADLSRRALELAPERHSLRGPLVVQAAMSLHAAGRIEEAIRFFGTRLADGHRDPADLHYTIGNAFHALRNEEGAKRAFEAALAEPSIRANLLQAAQEPVGGTADAFARLFHEDDEKYARLVKELDIKTN